MSEDEVELDVKFIKPTESEPTRKTLPSSGPKAEHDSVPAIGQTEEPPQSPPESRQQEPQQTLTVDDSGVTTHYANFCRISSTPEELILDLGLNPSPMSPGKANVAITERIILNHYTAKRLLSALAATLHQHERVFGTLETDVRRRLQGI